MSSLTSLWLTFFAAMFCVFISEKTTQPKYDLDGPVLRRNVMFTIATVLMSLFIGLRLWCNDTGTYLEIYNYLTSSTGSIFKGISFSIGDSPAFLLFNAILKHLGVSSQGYLMIYAFITVGLYMWFLRRNSVSVTMSVFLLWTMGVYTFAAAGMRQAVAIAIALVGIDRYINRKYVPFVFFVLLASFFHPYAILFLIAPYFTYSPWKNRTLYMFILFFVVGVMLQYLVGPILSITSMMGKNYSSTEFSGEGVNIFRLLVVWAPIVLSYFARNFTTRSNDQANNMFLNFSMLNASMMFVALFGTANYFARLANYFLIFQTLSLPWIVSFFNESNRKVLKYIVVVCYLLYFIFANMILTPFDSYFVKTSLWQYLTSLVGR